MMTTNSPFHFSALRDCSEYSKRNPQASLKNFALFEPRVKGANWEHSSLAYTLTSVFIQFPSNQDYI